MSITDRIKNALGELVRTQSLSAQAIADELALIPSALTIFTDEQFRRANSGPIPNP